MAISKKTNNKIKTNIYKKLINNPYLYYQIYVLKLQQFQITQNHNINKWQHNNSQQNKTIPPIYMKNKQEKQNVRIVKQSQIKIKIYMWIKYPYNQYQLIIITMFRFLFKWSLEITGAGIVGYHMLGPQRQQDVKGAYRSVTNSSRASIILFKSIYDYYYQLKGIQYNSEQYHKKRSEIHTRVANRILDLSKINKGIYLKLGQYLGNLDRVMPWEFTEVLKVLQDSGPSIPYEEIKVVIQEDLQMQPKQIFSKFDKQAFAAASLAQVHRAELGSNGKQVAVKIQFPFLRQQSKWDLWVLQKITQFCNYLMIKNSFKQVDLVSLYKTWTQTLVEQLDFQRQIANAEHTRLLFKNHQHLYIPKIYPQYSSQRIIVMQFIDGVKINDPQKIRALGLDTKLVGKTLIKIFADMIFKHGFVHCDAHPGNILVRLKPRNKDNFDIVLLDHGLYRTLDKQFIEDFSKFWISLIKFDKKNLLLNAKKLNIQRHYQYLPIIFLHRTINSTKKLGEPITPQQRKYFREHDIANFQSIHKIVQDLPQDLMFVIRATNLVASHNLKLGGSQRDRYLIYTQYCLRNMATSNFGYNMSLIGLSIRVWLYQHMNWLYKAIFGTL